MKVLILFILVSQVAVANMCFGKNLRFQERNYTLIEIKTLIDRWALDFGLDRKLVHSVVRQESGYQHDVVSQKGALGLMQLMPSTARSLGLSKYESLFDPVVNIYYGCKYLKKLINEFGSERLALIAYYSGPQRAKMIRARHYLPKKFKREITNYADRVLFRTGKNLGFLSISWDMGE